MAITILHKAETRGVDSYGWLQSYHTFSFGNYYNPERINFGALRVLNDDTVEPGMGFDTHHHENMEIISIPLEGEMEHRDSKGNKAVIKKGDVQVISAGKGILHSEYNVNEDTRVKFLQIWITPDEENVVPRYGHITLNPDDSHNRLQQIVSPGEGDKGVWIHQKAWLYLGRFDQGIQIPYNIRIEGNGIYVFVLAGTITIEGQELKTRDGLGIRETDKIMINVKSNAEILLMDIPMNIR